MAGCWLLLAALSALSGSAAAAELRSVGKIYFWPMSNALDQYLAEQVVAGGPFGVVVDPKLADAVMTERIDNSFLEAIKEYFPDARDSAEAPANTAEGIEGEVDRRRAANRPRGRPRGTIFLVDVRSRQVLWSTYIGDFDPSSKELHQRAQTVVDRLKKQMGTAPER